MTSSLKGRTALVTGAGRGIGRAIARELAERGVSVALVARSRDELTDSATSVRDLGGSAVVIQADIADPDQLTRSVTRARDELGVVDILINNAATVSPLGPSVRVDPADWAAAIGLNVVAVASLTFALLPGMLERKWGRVVNVSSGVVARPASMIGGNAYVTGKTALEAHTVNLAAELAGSGVTVNVYRPGSVDTAMQAWIRGQDPDRIGTGLHRRFTRSYDEGTLITPERSAKSLLDRLPHEATGQIWDVREPG
ncbi:3-oxoacyl-ACP reductase FabG [Actinoallomurus bryophytorum]|uniref:3-oxoacyl-[acyl-carrier protein] reductase n=1 Tax=Actinoallomurus bryophytorum TaxID=1490222 RepID=A0A543CQ89_9ACTN|nr:SDR family oxidoreductase [Actinoallomurus bryophytorum]TQL99273.1 3-oxoacyl-[acyl-carrier protein] reductase [Actinoallomurus bryophytorum]